MSSFKVYLNSQTGKYSKVKAKNKADVMQILQNAKNQGFYSYIIIKQIKDTDIPIARGKFSNNTINQDMSKLDVDWRIVDNMVVDWKKYKEKGGR